MTSSASSSPCALCGRPATATIEPPRRTLARGQDPSDPSFSVTVILPDVPLCSDHALDVREGERLIGWCDDQRCRAYGELGSGSVCGDPYKELGSRPRS